MSSVDTTAAQERSSSKAHKDEVKCFKIYIYKMFAKWYIYVYIIYIYSISIEFLEMILARSYAMHFVVERAI